MNFFNSYPYMKSQNRNFRHAPVTNTQMTNSILQPSGQQMQTSLDQVLPMPQMQPLIDQMLPGQQMQPSMNQMLPGQQMQPSMNQMLPMQQTQPSMNQMLPGQQMQPSMNQMLPGQQMQPSMNQMLPAQQMQPSMDQMLPGQQMQPSMDQMQQMNELKSQFKPDGIPPIIDITPYKYPGNLMAALTAIQQAVAGESEDRQFYEYLISVAPSQSDKDIITGIRDDEIKHFALFRQVYYMLTGRTLPPPKEDKFKKPASYCEGLRNALLGEQNAVRKYRTILYALQDRVLINILVEIITDEIRHGSLYNYLYSKNSCKV